MTTSTTTAAPPSTHRRRGRALASVAAGLLIATVPLACGDDDDSADTTTTTEATSDATTTTAAEAKTVEVNAMDYAFENLPKEVEAGTKLKLVNKSTKELHELVAFRLPDGETRPVSELVKLPQEEVEKLLTGQPAAVLLAPPGGEQITAVGDGTLTEPGRYAIICAIPTGADPAAYLKAASENPDGPPEVPGGPPHLVAGMFGELTVT